MTLQELFTDIANNILPSGVPNNIDAAKLRQAIESLGNFLDPESGEATFKSFIRHVVDSGTNLMAFESYFTSSRKSKAGEFALFYDADFLQGLVFARQLGAAEAPAPVTSGSFPVKYGTILRSCKEPGN